MQPSETQAVIVKLISYIATVLAFAAVALLLYLVVTELFLGREKVFKFEGTKSDSNKPQWLMPVVCAGALWTLWLVLAGFKNTIGEFAIFQKPTAGLFSMFDAVTKADGAGGWISTIIATAFYVATALMIAKIDDEKTALLFCLNPVAIFMVMPNTLSILAFTIALAAYAVSKKSGFVLALAVFVFIMLHIPFKSSGPLPIISIEEAVMLGWAALLVLLSKFGKKYYGTAEIISAILCGIVPAAYVLFM